MEAKIAVLAGDGIGEEVMREALRVLSAVAKSFSHTFHFVHGLIGGAAYDAYGVHFPEVSRQLCQDADAILFGSVGGPLSESALPKWHGCEVNSILAIRKAFSFHANLRPTKVYPALTDLCPLKTEVIGGGIDILIVRELLGDLYFGAHQRLKRGEIRTASDVAAYDEHQISKVAHVAFRAAVHRRGKVTSVDKANVLCVSQLWREVVSEVAREYPQITLEHLLVDNCAMQLITKPTQFDVIVTSNMFGDILSDEAAVFPGSLGLTPSASLNEHGFGMYEPSGGSAPDIAGKGIANPIAQVLSAAMMLRLSFGLAKEALAIERAVERTLEEGFRTQDLFRGEGILVETSAFTDVLLTRL